MRLRLLLGTAVSAAALGAGPASAQGAAPPNDAFAAAQPIMLGVPVQGTVDGATVQPSEPDHAGDRRTRSVWYAYTPAADGAVTLDACTASFDDVIATYTGATLTTLSPGPSVDDACNDLGAKVSLQVRAGVTVWIAIAGVGQAQGTFTLVAHPESVPPNDAFADAIALRPGRVQGSNALATHELGDPALAGAGGGSVWYRFRTGSRRRITLDTTNSSFDTVLGVFTGGPGTLHRVAADDDSGVADSSLLTFTARPRRTYRIMVDGFESGRGSFELGLSDGTVAGYDITLGDPQSTDLATVLARGLRTTVSCRRPCRLRVELRVSPATAQRIGLPRGAGQVLARRTGHVRGDGDDMTAVLRPTRAARRALRGRPAVTVSLRAELRGTRSRDRYVSRTIRLTS